MAKTIDMQFMRYINLFGKISQVPTSDCFVYNNTICFAVKPSMVSKALGKNGANIRALSETLRRRIRVISVPSLDNFQNLSDEEKKEIISRFILDVISPVDFGSLSYSDKVVSISGTREQKAMMIGRDRARQNELLEILKSTFDVKELKFV